MATALEMLGGLQSDVSRQAKERWKSFTPEQKKAETQRLIDLTDKGELTPTDESFLRDIVYPEMSQALSDKSQQMVIPPTGIPDRQNIDGKQPVPQPMVPRFGLSPVLMNDKVLPRKPQFGADLEAALEAQPAIDKVAPKTDEPNIEVPVIGGLMQGADMPKAQDQTKLMPPDEYVKQYPAEQFKQEIKPPRHGGLPSDTKPSPSDKAIDDVIGKDSSGVADWLKNVGKGILGVAAAPFEIARQGIQDIANLPPQELAPLLRGMQRALKPTPPRFGIPYSAGETFGTAASESLGGYLDERQKQQELALAQQKQRQLLDLQAAQIKEHEAKAKAFGEGRGLQTGTETWYNKITDKYMTLPKGVQAPEGFVPTAGLQQVSGAQKAQQQGEAIPIITKVDVALKQAKIDSLKKQGTKPKWKTPDGSPIFAGSSGFYTINDSGENISYKGQIEPIVGRPMSRKFNEIKLANPDLSDKEVHEKGLQEQRDMIKFGREETAKNQFSRLAYDTVTKSPVQVTAREMNAANKDDPNRILTLSKQTSDIVAKGLFLNEIDTGIKNIDTSIDGMAKENPRGISDSLRAAMKTVMSKDTPGLMREAVNTVVKGELAKKMTQSEQDYLISHARLAENAMALRGVLGIGNQSAVDIRNKIMDTLPDITKASDWDYMRRQSSALKSVLDIARDNSILIRRKTNASKQNITESRFKEILNNYKVDGEQGTSTQLLDELNLQGIYVNQSEEE